MIGAGRQLQLAPPLDVGEVAEGAAHRDAGALVRLGGGVREDGDLDVEQGRADRRAEQALVALVVGVRDERDARGEQLGAGGLDVDRRAVGAGWNATRWKRARVVAGLELGLGDRRLERDVPQPGRLGLVGLAAGEVAQERLLGGGARLGTPMVW